MYAQQTVKQTAQCKSFKTIGLAFTLYLAVIMSCLCLSISVSAAEPIKRKFTPSYRTHDGRSGQVVCSEGSRVCVERGEKTVEGLKVKPDCWKYTLTKTCQTYPSANDCYKWKHCYAIADRECLTWDSYGNCVNIKREFSCKRWDASAFDKEKVVFDPNDKTRVKQLMCKGVPCIDGNCVDKSYEMNDEMMDSVSKLYAVSKAKDGLIGSNIFPGTAMHCAKKAAAYSNCCGVSKQDLMNNWGHKMGAHCTKDENQLLENRRKDLCIYVGKENKGVMQTVVKHHYCCFGNMFNKVFQKEARKQLNMTFGSGGSPNCRGLTLDELTRLDFSKMDLSEAYADLIKKVKLPLTNDIDARVKGSLPSIRTGDNNPLNNDNKYSGHNMALHNQGGEISEEEKAKQAEQKRLADAEEARRQAEAAKQAELARRKAVKEQEIANTRRDYEAAYASCYQQRALMDGRYLGGMNYQFNKMDTDIKHLPQYPEYLKRFNIHYNLKYKLERLENELRNGQY